jgi:hypothetical protein
MDIQTLMPLLMNLLGGGNNPLQNLFSNKQNQQPAPQNIPQEVLASYPSSYTQNTNNTLIHNQAPQESNGQQSQNMQFNMPNIDMLKNLMPLLQNTNKQKNSPLTFSELKSVDEYTF